MQIQVQILGHTNSAVLERFALLLTVRTDIDGAFLNKMAVKSLFLELGPVPELLLNCLDLLLNSETVFIIVEFPFLCCYYSTWAQLALISELSTCNITW